MAPIHESLQHLKFGLKFESREVRTEFALAQAGLPGRKLPDHLLQKVKAELERLSQKDRPAHVRRFAELMRQRYPELQVHKY